MSVELMKEWLSKWSNKSADPTNAKCGNMVLTPQNIPQFTIPRSLESLPSTSSECISDADVSLTSSEGSLSTYGSITHRSASTSPGLYPPAPAQHSRSAPVSPQRTSSAILDDLPGGKVLPKSTMPCIRTKVCYGLETLAELPHTRRKESIYHSDTSLTKSLRLSTSKVTNKPSTLSLRSSCASSPTHSHTELPKTNDTSPPERVTVERCRRASLPCSKEHLSSWESSSSHTMGPVSSSLCSSASDNAGLLPKIDSHRPATSSSSSHRIPRRAGSFDQKRAPHIAIVATPPRAPITSPVLPLSLFTKHLQSPLSSNHGEINISCQYLPDSLSLKVLISKAKNLGGSTRGSTGVSPYIKLCLMPGKVQKQRTKVVRANSNPNFQAEFYFANLSLQQVRSMQLRVKVMNKGASLKKTDVLGEQQVILDEFDDLLVTNSTWLKLLNKLSYKFGTITVACCFEPKKSGLTVTIHRVADLPRNSITGLPDPYVKISLIQPRGQICNRQSKTVSASSEPCFKESFSFDISTKIEDLRYTTLTLTVYDRQRLRSDGVIGQVQMGLLMQDEEEAEVYFWRGVLQNPGCFYEGSFPLREVENNS